jgi:hypothetical protein
LAGASETAFELPDPRNHVAALAWQAPGFAYEPPGASSRRRARHLARFIPLTKALGAAQPREFWSPSPSAMASTAFGSAASASGLDAGDANVTPESFALDSEASAMDRFVGSSVRRSSALLRRPLDKER